MTINNKNIIDFTIELDKLLFEEKHMFCPRLLELLDKYLHIKHTVLIVHRNRNYSQLISRNISEKTDALFHESYHKEDVVVKYAEDHWDRLYDNYEFVLSTDVIPAEEYDTHEYVKFLNQTGTHYLMAMLFDEFFLAIHKTKKMGPFTESELNFYHDIYRLIRHKHKIFLEQKQFDYLQLDENDTLNHARIGSMIFDNENKLIKYNQFAKEYCLDILFDFNTKKIYEDLKQKLSISSIKDEGTSYYTTGNFYIMYRYHFHEDYYKNKKRYLSVIIMKQANDPISAKDIQNFKSLSLRELDVVQVLSLGLKYQEVAEELSISVNTVRTHLKHVHKKLGIKNQRDLIRLYLQYEMFIKQNK